MTSIGEGWTCSGCGKLVPFNTTHGCTITPTNGGTGITFYPTCGDIQRDHEYAKFDRKRLFCRHCGQTKVVA